MGHFGSKDALATEACSRAFKQSAARWRKRTSGKTQSAAARAALVESYLSTQSRNSPGTGCPAASLANDVAREAPDTSIRTAYVDGVEELLGIMCSVQNTGDPHADRHQALTQFSTMLGALVLARATNGSEISDEFLAAARKSLLPPSPPARMDVGFGKFR